MAAKKDISADLGVRLETMEDAMHLIQIAKAIKDGDIDSYKAVMSAMGKTIKTDPDNPQPQTATIITANGTVIHI